MKSLVIIKRTILIFFLCTCQINLTMENKQEEKPVFSLNQITEEYYKNNSTILVPTQALKDTIIQVQKLPENNSLGISANIEEFSKAIQIGAFYVEKITQSNSDEIDKLAQTITAPDVPNIIKYLYSKSCTIRPDQTGFTEGIIIINSDSSYYTGLKNFFEAYHKRVLKGNAIQKSSTLPLIQTAKTEGAYRLMCMTITETNQEKMAPFLDKFEDFHITISDKAIYIKPERHPKIGVLNKIKVKLEATANFGPKYNKPTDIPNDLINTFVRTFPNTKLTKITIGSMYEYITKVLAQETDKKFDILKCKSIFEKIAAIKGLSHLKDRIGSEIILGDEELIESYFSEKNHPFMTNEWKNACGIYLTFKKLRDTIRTYIIEDNTNITENMVREDIDKFYKLTAKNNIKTIGDSKIEQYFINTALTLKYLASIKEEQLPNTTITTLKERLSTPVFEIDYQKKLNLALIAEQLLLEQQQKTDSILDEAIAKKIAIFWETYQNTFTKEYPWDLDKNLDIGKFKINSKNDLFESCGSIYSKVNPAFCKLSQTAHDLKNLPKTTKLLNDCVRRLVGTAIVATQEKNEWNIKKLEEQLLAVNNDLKTTTKDLATTIEKHGYFCSSGEKGKQIITKTYATLYKNEKEPKAITMFKKTIQIFPTIEALENKTTEVIKQQDAINKIFIK